MKKYQQCTRCIMDNTSDDTIIFDSSGYCNYCNDLIARLPNEYFPNEDGKKILNDMVKKIKADCKNDKYDCLVGISGGIDSSYMLYLCHTLGLRVLAIHIDDGLDNPIAVDNIDKLINKTGATLVNITPNREEYADLLYCLLKASVSNLAFVQDNLINFMVDKYGRENNIKYIFDGSNVAQEGILERAKDGINACDSVFIYGIHKRFGRVPLEHLQFMTLMDRYVWRHFQGKVQHFRPLNYIDYNFDNVLETLRNFCGYEYYGGKHYESILTRFLQCYYLPVKFAVDKRKSHLSSLIATGQMTREKALERMKLPLYPSAELLQQDKEIISSYIGISVDELDKLIIASPQKMSDYPRSVLNKLAPLARKFRKWIE